MSWVNISQQVEIVSQGQKLCIKKNIYFDLDFISYRITDACILKTDAKFTLYLKLLSIYTQLGLE